MTVAQLVGTVLSLSIYKRFWGVRTQ